MICLRLLSELWSEPVSEDMEISRGLAKTEGEIGLSQVETNARSRVGGSFVSCLFSERDLSIFIN